MTPPLNQSDIQLIRSGRYGKGFLRCPTTTPTPVGAGFAVNRADRTRLSDRDLQALRPSQLSLRRRTWTRTQAIFIDDCANRRATPARLCTECDLSKSRGVSWQLPHASGDAQRDLCDQCRASAPPRESRLNGPGDRNPRYCKGGRHHRQHDRILSCCRCRAAQCGRSRACC